MNILLESRAFYPSVGGIEMMSRELALYWQSAGHAVQVVTITPLNGSTELKGLRVERNPPPADLRRQVRKADVFVQNGISLRSLHWSVLETVPTVIVHQSLLPGPNAPLIRGQLKRLATYLGWNVAISRPVAESIPGPTVRIPNTFRSVFDQTEARSAGRRGLLFVGRLVSEKGGDVAIDALRRLHDRGINVSLTICGDGPERASLMQQTERLGLEDMVSFEGWTGPDELAERYRSAEVLVVPSRYEPFGIVALEAIASRCPVVASDTGGLPEAVGECGLLIPPDHPEALADAIERVLRTDVQNDLRAHMPKHVRRHRIDRVGTDYLHLLRTVAQSRS